MYHPDSPVTNYEAARALSEVLIKNPDNLTVYVFAKKHYERAGLLDPNFKMSWLGLINLNCMTGKEIDRMWVDELTRRLQQTTFSLGDRSLMLSLKEMSIAHTLCLKRPDMQALFFAAFSNPTVSTPVLAMLYSWYADYLLLRENDVPAAKAALGKSLQLAPQNPSNQLKWAQLVFLEGNKDEAISLLKVLQNAQLSSGEKKTSANLLACLEGVGVRCEKI
jgi:tetratricopeptide (TPR) repeat protein